MLDVKRVLASAPRKPEHVELQRLFTPWGEQRAANEGDAAQAPSTNTALSPHPHPQFARAHFDLLDGWWDYAIVTADATLAPWSEAPVPNTWDGRIRVPFSPEAPLSQVERQLMPHELLWYRRTFAAPVMHDDDRCMLHFEAVDYACACYVNGTRTGEHQGGYLPFSFDITDALAGAEVEVCLCVWDPSDTGVQLRGKQKLQRGGIWYTAQSGIWQSVWTEVIPRRHLEALTIDAQPDEGQLVLDVRLGKNEAAGDTADPLVVRLLDNGCMQAQITCDTQACAATVSADGSSTTCRVVLTIANPHLWSPDDPHLYDLELTYGRDQVTSYCAFRTVSIQRDAAGVARVHINHQPLFLRGVLDQGYWPDGLMTAPADEALIFDIQTCKNLGFNMLRKHIKVESDRWYYHCDRLGMLVWQDMVSGGSPLSSWHSSYKPTFFRASWGHYADDVPAHYRNLSAGADEFRAEWTTTCADTVSYLRNHPSIITWVLFNEGWGQFEARTATEAVRALDPTRPIDAVSGWYDQACGDFLSVHNYFRPLEVYRDTVQPPRAFVISEFGGLSYHLSAHSVLASSYGYATLPNLASFQAAAQETFATADALEAQGLAGFVYTQLSDVEEETNGLLTYDRRINKLTTKEQS